MPEEWRGKTILQLDLRKRYGINILGVRRAGRLDMGVGPDTVLDGGSPVLILGRQKEVNKFLRI